MTTQVAVPGDRSQWNTNELNKLGEAVVELQGVANGGSLSALVAANEAPVRNVTADVTRLDAPNGTLVTVQTGYAGNDVVEPSILYDSTAPYMADANGKNGYEYVLCATPYFNADDQYENPCLWVSHDGNTWYPIKYATAATTTVPAFNGSVDTAYVGGYAVTPVVATLAQGDGKLSDPVIVRDPTTGLYTILFTQFLTAVGSGGTGTGGKDWGTKAVTATSLAGPWSAPVTVLSSIRATTRPLCPAPFWDGTQWQIYAVDIANLAATVVQRYTAASLTGTWTLQANPSIPIPTAYSSQVWWHLNAYRWGNGHLLLISDDASGGSGGGNLWAVISNDGGTTWTVPKQPLMSGTVLYRSALVTSVLGSGVGFDLFYATSGASWQMYRTSTSVGQPGVHPNGKRVAPGVLKAGQIKQSPYVFGDSVNRADNAGAAGTPDSGQAYTVANGSWGVSSKQLYATTTVNDKLVVLLPDVANGIYACEFSVYDSAGALWLIARYVDTNNYIRFGANAAGGYTLQNIVAGAVSQTLTISPAQVPVTGDIVQLVCEGTTVTVFVNGIQVGQVTAWTANQTGSGIGLQTNGIAGNRFRNLCARTLSKV